MASVLTVNAGSSSVKLHVVSGDDILAATEVQAPEGRGGDEALREFVANGPVVDAAAHRFVHGGSRLRGSTLADPGVIEELAEVAELAPLHQHAALACLHVLRELRPDLPQIACFDTAFHSTLSQAAITYAVPWDWTERLGMRRYGFHGLSHAYASRRAAELLGRDPAVVRVVTCHLGAGASLCAVAGGGSVDTTMGFTPNDGLVMATRSGAVDPSGVLWAVESAGLTPAEGRAAIEHQGGLLGISGISSDMREVLAAAARAEPRAVLARDVYVHRLRAAIAAMAAAMGGVDALVFTGGVGENASEIRSAACERLGFLGVQLDGSRNDAAHGDGEIGATDAQVAVLVISAREELELAAEARRVLRA